MRRISRESDGLPKLAVDIQHSCGEWLRVPMGCDVLTGSSFVCPGCLMTERLPEEVSSVIANRMSSAGRS